MQPSPNNYKITDYVTHYIMPLYFLAYVKRLWSPLCLPGSAAWITFTWHLWSIRARYAGVFDQNVGTPAALSKFRGRDFSRGFNHERHARFFFGDWSRRSGVAYRQKPSDIRIKRSRDFSPVIHESRRLHTFIAHVCVLNREIGNEEKNAFVRLKYRVESWKKRSGKTLNRLSVKNLRQM